MNALPVHDDALGRLVQGCHQLLINDHLGDNGVHVVRVELKHVSKDWLKKTKIDLGE